MKNRRKLNKGLKLLSVIVYDIVLKKRETTYKHVADLILQNSMDHNQLNLNSRKDVRKEEQNIKRRVYDALNVLISAGLLAKDKKVVTINSRLSQVQINPRRMRVQITNSKNKHQKLVIEDKLNMLYSLKRKLFQIKKILKRNRQDTRESYIAFPFILVDPSSEPGTKLNFKIQQDHKRF